MLFLHFILAGLFQPSWQPQTNIRRSGDIPLMTCHMQVTLFESVKLCGAWRGFFSTTSGHSKLLPLYSCENSSPCYKERVKIHPVKKYFIHDTRSDLGPP